jgi:hypothetical protein
MSAAVWNEPQEPELRCREARRPTGASWDTSNVLTTRIVRAPRPAADRDPRVAGTAVRR